MRRFFWPKMCKTGYHSTAGSMQNPMEVITNQLLNYSGYSWEKNELGGQKSKIVSENRKKHFERKSIARFGDGRTQLLKSLNVLFLPDL